MISFICSGCGANLNIGDEWTGKIGRCPHCGTNSRVPGYPRRTAKTTIIARFLTWPMICLAIPSLLLGWPVFLGGIVAAGLFIFFAWAFTNIGGAIWCKLDGTSHYLKLWKSGGGDPFFDCLDSPLNNDPPSVRFQELYREKLRRETAAVNRQFALPDNFMTGNGPASPPASEIPNINDPNIVM